MTQTIIKIPAAGAFDPTDITLTDDTSGALLIKEGSNEYMRINTTNGSELTQFKMPFTTGEFKYIQETSAGPYEFIKADSTSVRLFPGSTGGGFNFNRVEVTTSHVHLTAGSEIRIGASLPVSGSGARVFPLAGQSWTELLNTGSTSKIQRVSDGLKLLEVDTDSNATFTLDDSVSAVFKVQDNAGTPNNLLKIDLTGTNDIEMNLGQYHFKDHVGNTVMRYLAPNSFRFGANSSSGTGAYTAVGDELRIECLLGGGAKIVNKMRARGGGHGDKFRVSSNTETNFEIDQDSNATYTLGDGTGATFTITDDNATPKLHLRCTQSAVGNPYVEVNGLQVFPTKQLNLSSATYGTAFAGSINQARWSISLGATSATRNINIGAVAMDNFAQILTATPSTTGQTFTLDFNNTSTALSGLPIGLYKIVLKNAGTQSCTFTAASTMAGGGRVKGVDVSGASIGVIDSSSGSITAAAGETIYVEVTNHVSDSAGGNANRFIICKTICKI